MAGRGRVAVDHGGEEAGGVGAGCEVLGRASPGVVEGGLARSAECGGTAWAVGGFEGGICEAEDGQASNLIAAASADAVGLEITLLYQPTFNWDV